MTIVNGPFERDESSLSPVATVLLKALRAEANEGTLLPGEDPDGVYECAYLWNVKRPEGMTPHQFAGYLAELEKKGFYISLDGDFGYVRLSEDAVNERRHESSDKSEFQSKELPK